MCSFANYERKELRKLFGITEEEFEESDQRILATLVEQGEELRSWLLMKARHAAMTQDMTQAADNFVQEHYGNLSVTSPPVWDRNLGPTPLAEAAADEFDAQRKAALPYLEHCLLGVFTDIFTYIEENAVHEKVNDPFFDVLLSEARTLMLLEDGEL